MKIQQSFTLIFVLLMAVISRAGTLIDNVSIESSGIAALASSKSTSTKTDTVLEKAYTVSWRLPMSGTVTVVIVDLQGNIMMTFRDKEELSAGSHTVTWNGKDAAGHQCPDGLYFPVIRIKTKTRGVETYNPTAEPWGEEIVPDSISYDASAQVIRYTLSTGVLCRLRVGEKDGGPLYKTVANWKYRAPGTYEEPWDGMDMSGIIKATETDKFKISLDAFSLPSGTILLTDTSLKLMPQESLAKYKKMTVYPPRGKRVAFYPTLTNGLLPDLAISSDFSKAVSDKQGRAQLSGKAVLSLDVTQGILLENSGETFESLFYVDGILLQEDKLKMFPSQIMVDTKKLANGAHVVTINLRTSGDRAASTSRKIFVNN